MSEELQKEEIFSDRHNCSHNYPKCGAPHACDMCFRLKEKEEVREDERKKERQRLRDLLEDTISEPQFRLYSPFDLLTEIINIREQEEE